MEAEPSNPPEYKNAAGFAPPVVTTTVSAGGRTYVNLDSKNWQGGTTTVVTPSSAAPLFADLQSHTMMEERKVNRGGGRKSASLKDEELCPEEEERRRVRRERNKLAAARCRKKRVDQTETLQIEVNNWEEKKRMLQDEIHSLQAQKEELQFILEAHKSVCKQSQARSMVSKSELSEPRVAVKAEPPTEMETVRHLTHAEAMDQVQVHSNFWLTQLRFRNHRAGLRLFANTFMGFKDELQFLLLCLERVNFILQHPLLLLPVVHLHLQRLSLVNTSLPAPCSRKFVSFTSYSSSFFLFRAEILILEAC